MTITRRRLLGAAPATLVASPAPAKTNNTMTARTLITAPATWYVDGVNGSDASDGSTPAVAFKTIQYGLDILTAQYDFAAVPTLQLLASGGQTHYRERVNLNRWVGSAANFRVIGDPANNANVVVAPQNSHAIASSHAAGSPWQIESLMVQSSPGYYGIISDAGSHITTLNMNFGGCGVAHMFAEFGGFIETLWDPVTLGNYVISGGANSHVQVGNGGIFTSQNNTITFQNNPTLPQGLVSAGVWGLANLHNIMGYSGARNLPSKYYTDGTGEIAGPQAGWP